MCVVIIYRRLSPAALYALLDARRVEIEIEILSSPALNPPLDIVFGQADLGIWGFGFPKLDFLGL